jgi:hypothetical protein
LTSLIVPAVLGIHVTELALIVMLGFSVAAVFAVFVVIAARIA